MQRRHFIHSLAGLSATLPLAGIPAFAAEASPLAGHRIAALEFRRVNLRWPRHVGKNAKLDNHGHGPEVRAVVIKTDQGATGWAEVPGGPSDEQLRQLVVGKSVAGLINPQSGIRSDHLFPLDIALHDLAAVILGVPVWKMIGGGEKPHLPPLYTGMIYFDDLDGGGIDKVLENAADDHRRGYRHFKAKIGRNMRWMKGEPGLKRDIEVVRALAGAFPDSTLLVDSNDGHTPDDAIAFLKGIGDIRLLWFEEPFVETIDAWTRLHAWAKANGHGKMLLADGEQGNDYLVLEQLEADGILNVRLCDIMGYGFTRWRKLLPALLKTGTQASPHTWGSALKTIYTAHFVAAFGNCPTVEGVTTATEEVDFGGNVLRDGAMQVSDAPGFGLALRD